MFGTDSLSINALGHLTLGGADIPALAEKYGTPLYLMDESGIRKACRDWLEAGRKQFGEKFLPAFASKAFCVSTMYRLLSEEGFGADVVSGGELYTAHRAGFETIPYSSPLKTPGPAFPPTRLISSLRNSPSSTCSPTDSVSDSSFADAW